MGFYGHVIQEIRRLFSKLKVQFVSANDEPTTNILEEEAPVEKLYEPSGAWDEFGIAPKNRWITLHNDSSATEVRLTVGHAAAGAAIEGSETQGFTPVEDLPKDEGGTPLTTATDINYGQYLKVPTLTFDATGHLAAPADESTNPVYDYFKLPMLTIKANDAVIVSNKNDNILYCKGNQWITFDSEEDNKKLIIQHKIIAPGQENAEVRQGTSKWEYKYPSDLTWCETETLITTETPPSIESRNNFTIKSPIIPMEGIASAVSAKVLYNTLVEKDQIQSTYLSSSLGTLKTDEQTQITRLTFGDVIKTDEIQVDAMGHIIGIQNKYFMLPISDVPQRLSACEDYVNTDYTGLNTHDKLSALVGKFTDIYPASGDSITFINGTKKTIAETIGSITNIYPLTTENNYYAAPKSLTETIGSYANIYNSSIPNSPKSLTEIIGKLDGDESMLSAMQSLNGEDATCLSISHAIQQIVTKYNASIGAINDEIDNVESRLTASINTAVSDLKNTDATLQIGITNNKDTLTTVGHWIYGTIINENDDGSLAGPDYDGNTDNIAYRKRYYYDGHRNENNTLTQIYRGLRGTLNEVAKDTYNIYSQWGDSLSIGSYSKILNLSAYETQQPSYSPPAGWQYVEKLWQYVLHNDDGLSQPASNMAAVFRTLKLYKDQLNTLNSWMAYVRAQYPYLDM